VSNPRASSTVVGAWYSNRGGFMRDRHSSCTLE
jgi:hypothetical protein